MQTLQTELPPFAPHIEARRSQYVSLANWLISLLDFHFETETLDLQPNPVFQPEPGTKNILMNSIDSHMSLLLAELEMLDANSIRRFYVEMWLHVDQLRWEQEERKTHR